MKHKPKRLFITITPQFPYSKGYVATYTDKNGVTKGVLTYPDKASLMIDIDAAIPDDDSSIDVNFDLN